MPAPKPSKNKHYVTTFYRFTHFDDAEGVKALLAEKANQWAIRGLIILGKEGLNATVAATSLKNLEGFKSFIRELTKDTNLFFKNSESDIQPFRRFTIKVRPEIVTAGIPEMSPPEGVNHHLSPAEWNEVLKKEDDYVLIDTRNWYETQIGTFKGAVVPPIDVFTDFPEYIESQGVPKDKKVLIFCTGGIRCEKGILEMQERGYQNTYQLEGGILNYIEQFPNDQFEGECFVFDRRVALDQNLKPTQKYSLCPHDGQPAWTDIICRRCGTEAQISVETAKDPIKSVACSKHCAYRLSVNFEEKGPRQYLPEQDMLDAAETRNS